MGPTKANQPMRAVYLQSYKEPDSIVVGDRPAPEPGSGEVLVKLHAASCNRVDLYMFNGGIGITHELPLTLGVDGAGVIEAAGPNVEWRRPGDRVVLYPARFGHDEFTGRGDQMLALDCKIIGEHIDGTFADYIVVPEACAFPIADELSYQDAAALPVAYLTAWRMVTTLGQVAPQDTVLIHGIGGGVSLAALQFCKMVNARTIVTSSSDAKLERAAEYGADVRINYARQDVLAEVVKATDGRGVDVVVENVGKATWDVSLKSLVRGGRLVVCGATTGANPPADLQRIFIRQLKLFGATIGNFEEFRSLISAAERRLFAPIFDQVFALEEAPAALRKLDSGEQFGKLGLKMD